MRKKLFATALAVSMLATPAVAFAGGDANNAAPASPGACNMLHASDAGLNGMMNDRQVFDIMVPLVVASLNAGCAHP